MMRLKPVDVMIDIETAGIKPGCVILSIGGYVVGPHKQQQFYIKIDPQSCRDAGLSVSAQTMAWWKKQNQVVRDEAFSGETSIHDALLHLADYLTLLGEFRIWGNGASFDVPILEAAYEACGIKVPWKYHQSMCYRTMKNLYPHIKAPINEMKHSALEDARVQAEHLHEIFNYMQASEEAV